MAIGSTVQEFAKITTIHGIAYIFDRAIKSIDKFLWFLIVCFGAGVAVYMSLDAWKTWKDAPVLTSVSSTGLPLRKIDFPAITICSQGLIQVNDFKSKAAWCSSGMVILTCPEPICLGTHSRANI